MNVCVKERNRRLGLVYLTFIASLMFHDDALSRNEVGAVAPTISEPDFKIKAALPTLTDLETTTIQFNSQQYDGLYTVGGVRLQLELNKNSLSAEDQEQLPNVIWTFNQAGRVCDDMKVLSDNSNCRTIPLGFEYQREDNAGTTDNEQFTIFWEPLGWDLSMNALITARTNYGNRVITSDVNGTTFTVPYPESTFELLISSRLLGPAAAGEEPTEGNDVKMLEQMLWQLGGSPSGSPGASGTRVAENQRSLFKTGNNSVGKMVGRFNYFSHSPINKTTDYQTFINTTHNGVTYNTIDELKKHWTHYLQAYNTSSYDMTSKQSFNYADLLQTDKSAAEAVFDGVVNYPRGVAVAGIDATYTTNLHDNVTLYGAFERIDILKAMAQQEASGQHWGDKDNYRVKVGGSDEAGSKGFNQIQNKYTYGGLALDGTTTERSQICAGVSAFTADGTSQVNHYDPGQNLVAKAVWLTGTQGNCGRSFRRAFHDNSYTGTYQSAAGTTLLKMITGTQREAIASGTHADDTYELLTKGIGAYNQGAGVFNGGNGNAWVSLLSHQKTRTSPGFLAMVARGYDNLSRLEKLDYGRTKGMEYGMSVMHDADKLHLPYRKYIWQGGTYPANLTDAAGNPDPRAGQAWCFEYGESEWLSGTAYAQVKQNASDTDARGNAHIPQGRIDCVTGNPI